MLEVSVLLLSKHLAQNAVMRVLAISMPTFQLTIRMLDDPPRPDAPHTQID
jgi:hypothetical protein